LLPHTGVSTVASTSVRVDGGEPVVVRVDADRLAAAVATEVASVRHRHHNTGIVAPDRLYDAIDEALRVHGLRACRRVQHLERDEVPVFGAEAVKGLEFDGVVVVNPAEIVADGGEHRGARLLYVAMTRAVQVLHLVSDRDLPAELGGWQSAPSIGG
jgi:DNA helicase IV